MGYSCYSGDPGVIMSHLTCTLEHILPGYSCKMHTAWYVTGRLTCLADSIARCHSRQYFSINQLGTGWSYVEKPATTQTTVATVLQSIWLERLTPILEDLSLNPCVDRNTALWYHRKPMRYSLPYCTEYLCLKDFYRDHGIDTVVQTTFIDLWTVTTYEYSGFGTEIYMTKFSILIDYCIWKND